MFKSKTFQSDKGLALGIASLLSFALFAVVLSFPNSTDTSSRAASSKVTGNGSPNGQHYNLNIIGQSKEKKVDMSGNNGRRIFVTMDGTSTINLYKGTDYKVLDANGLDGTAAFQLPNPDEQGTGTTFYSVYARALAKPGGKSQSQTCFTEADKSQWCSTYSSIQVRNDSQSVFTNVTESLLYVYVDTDNDRTPERYPIFDTKMKGVFWDYDNTGAGLIQLRFYKGSTTVPTVYEG
jgi:hypothetical protein